MGRRYTKDLPVDEQNKYKTAVSFVATKLIAQILRVIDEYYLDRNSSMIEFSVAF